MFTCLGMTVVRQGDFQGLFARIGCDLEYKEVSLLESLLTCDDAGAFLNEGIDPGGVRQIHTWDDRLVCVCDTDLSLGAERIRYGVGLRAMGTLADGTIKLVGEEILVARTLLVGVGEASPSQALLPVGVGEGVASTVEGRLDELFIGIVGGLTVPVTIVPKA